MTREETLRISLESAEVDKGFTEAVLQLSDGTRLCFCHRVGERWAKAVGPEDCPDVAGLAGELLEGIRMFRLNAKHLDIQFEDGSRWDEPIR